MAGRFIKLYDKILQWEWFGHPNTVCLFIYLLLKANYKDSRFAGIVVKRGQLVTSLSKLATSVGLSIQQTKTSLSHLISTGEITSEATNQYRIITVVKYDDYQTATSESTSNQQTTNKRSNKQLTSEATTSIEYIEQIEHIEQIENNSPTENLVQREGFDRFWSLYPRKEAKKNAEVAWKKLKMTDELFHVIIAGLLTWIDSDQWTRDGGRYIPLPASWLNGRRWEDEVKPKPATATAPAKRVLNAQDFEQRDYSNVPADMMSDLAKELAEFEKTGEVL